MGPMKSITHFLNNLSTMIETRNISSFLQGFPILWQMLQRLQYSLAPQIPTTTITLLGEISTPFLFQGYVPLKFLFVPHNGSCRAHVLIYTCTIFHRHQACICDLRSTSNWCCGSPTVRIVFECIHSMLDLL
jgi:hypothetical protein